MANARLGNHERLMQIHAERQGRPVSRSAGTIAAKLAEVAAKDQAAEEELKRRRLEQAQADAVGDVNTFFIMKGIPGPDDTAKTHTPAEIYPPVFG